MSLTAGKSFQVYASDFHLGEGTHLADGALNLLEDFEHDDDFSAWLRALHAQFGGVRADLNLMGDIFDPLQVRFLGELVDPPEEPAAVYKLKQIIKGHPRFFEALVWWVGCGRRIRFFIGNHDAFLAWPRVQELLQSTIAQQEPELVEVVQRLTYEGTYCEHGNRDTLSRLNWDELFTELPGSKQRILNMPAGTPLAVKLINALKLQNRHAGRMARHIALYRDTLFRNWRFLWFCASQWFRTLAGVASQFWNERGRGRATRLRRAAAMLLKIIGYSFWDEVFGYSLEREARTIVREKRVDAVIFGHTHTCLKKLIGRSWYANTGTWSTRYAVVPARGFWGRIRTFFRPTFERADKLTYVVTEHENGRTTDVRLEE